MCSFLLPISSVAAPWEECCGGVLLLQLNTLNMTNKEMHLWIKGRSGEFKRCSHNDDKIFAIFKYRTTTIRINTGTHMSQL